MKKLITMVVILFTITYAQFTTPTVNGTIGASEYGTHTDGSNQGTNGQTWYMTWNNTNLYIALSSSTTSEALVLYMDYNPIGTVNGGSNSDGSLVGFNYDGAQFSVLPFRADFVLYAKNGYYEFRQANGSNGWTAQTTTGVTYSENAGVVEISIPWATLTGTSRPASFNWFGYKTSGSGFVYSDLPSALPSATVGLSATAQYYYTVSSTADGSPTKPFSQTSYTNDGTSTSIAGGTFFDFTYNSVNFFTVTAGLTVNGTLNLPQSQITFDENSSVKNLTLASGTTLNTANTKTLTVTGTFTNGGATLTGGGTLSFDGASAQSISGAFQRVRVNNTAGVTFSATSSVSDLLHLFDGSLTIGENTTVNAITLVSGKTLTVSASKSLTVNSSFTNLGATISGTGTIVFASNSDQNITGDFVNITLNKTGGSVSLSGNSSISGTLTLTSGFLSLGSNNLTLGASSSISGTFSATNMIVTNGSGELRKTFTGNGFFNFPVGDNTVTAEYSPLNINLMASAYSSAYVSVKVIDAKHPNNTSSTDFLSRYWTVGQSGITGFSGPVSAYYLDSDVNGTESSIQEAFYTSSWTLDGTVNAGFNFLNINVNSVGDFTGGEASALPVELTSFASSVAGTTVQLNWATATEVDNYGFEVERSVDNVSFSKIGFVAGAGNSSVQKQYSYSDANLASGTYYYRLKQVDTDGSFEYSQVVKSEVVGTPTEFSLSQNYPNPFNPSTSIAFALPKESSVKLSVYNMLGEEVAVLVNGVMSAGNHSVDFAASNLNSGMYVYRLEAGEFSSVRKMTLLK